MFLDSYHCSVEFVGDYERERERDGEKAVWCTAKEERLFGARLKEEGERKGTGQPQSNESVVDGLGSANLRRSEKMWWSVARPTVVVVSCLALDLSKSLKQHV